MQSAFFEEGKSWVCKSYNPILPDTESVDFKVSVIGDTIVNGEKTVKLCLESFAVPQDFSFYAAKEENGRILVFSDYYEEFVPLIDFNLKRGDKVNGNISISDIDSMWIEGYSREVLTLQDVFDESATSYWIEDVGANTDVYLTSFEKPVGFVTEIVECYLKDVCIYSAAKLKDYSGVPDLRFDESTQTFFDVNGLHIQNPKAGQIYIRRQGSAVSKVMLK
jgi:hypothetical protein